MSELDSQLAKIINEQQWLETARQNVRANDRPPFASGDWVWVLRPPSSSVSKLDTWWVGPVKVLRRTGAQSYEVLLKPGTPHDVHMDQLKPCVVGPSIDLYHFQPGYHIEGTTQYEWNVDSILDHKTEHGQLFFRVRWENADPNETTWEPIRIFSTGTRGNSRSIVKGTALSLTWLLTYEIAHHRTSITSYFINISFSSSSSSSLFLFFPVSFWPNMEQASGQEASPPLGWKYGMAW